MEGVNGGGKYKKKISFQTYRHLEGVKRLMNLLQIYRHLEE